MSLPPLVSRLPQVGTTVFTQMSQLALEHDAVNLGQGFPDFACDPKLVELVAEAMRAGHNQYAPMTGMPVLRQAIAAKIEATYGHRYDANTEITVTVGASQAIHTAILAVVHPGDEVIVIEPAYDCYAPAIALAGGVVAPVAMRFDEAGFSVPWDEVAAAVTPRTRMIVVNTPHNPTGTILRQADLDALAAIVDGTSILVLSDEVYEHMVYDGEPHASVSRDPRLAERAFVVSSFGKAFHVTGWKIGHVAAPAALMTEFRKVHQYNVFCVTAPMQHAIAAYLQDPAPWRDLPAFYQAKRDLFRAGLAGSRFTLLPSDGTYFQCVRYDAVSDLSEADFARWLTTEIKVAAIPVSAFYGQPKESRVVRFCFAKKDATLQLALERLGRL
ncbi:methionine aminotransferase [Massilia sp. UYP32]|jgi:methionine transaminase|uniref:pyridoxal phosphate-dependent aminotransferase n=1 Tax=Massilia TaxID=149698 RepID=UPI001C63283E|nr:MULTISPECIES: pyridoxal phosphate-dependent aminotransferase [Massilia]QYG02448.1 pyridoxal phosphate-dependent aminotransferase [Massilia sp. NP310]